MLRSNKGFGLVEVMISLAILSVVVAGTMQAMQNAMLVSTTADQKANLNSLIQSEMGIAFDQITCTQAITRVQNRITSGPLIFDVLTPGTNLPEYSLTVITTNFNNPTLVATAYDGSKTYRGTLTVTMKSNKVIYGPQVFAPRTIASFYVLTAPSGIVISCGGIMPALPQPPQPVINNGGNPNNGHGEGDCNHDGR